MSRSSRASTKPVVLLVDKDREYAKTLMKTMNDAIHFHTVSDGEAAIGMIESDDYDAILLETKLKENMDGLNVLQRIKNRKVNVPVLMLAKVVDSREALQAGRLGASDYISKDATSLELHGSIRSAIDENSTVNEQFPQQQSIEESQKRFIGKSESVHKILLDAEIVARVNSTVLVTGENGTGKEVLARFIHGHSLRAENPFIAVNCAAIPDGLVESELFGHMRGAFTGATANRRGSFEIAGDGTLFLDEITEMPFQLQPKLLRALQSGEFSPVGSEETISSNARVICSSNRDLEKAVADGKLRQDLYYRINVVSFYVPPLRDRKEDILVLARHFLREKANELGKRIEKISPEAESLLLSHDWPGNARELENLIERAIVFCHQEEIGPELLGPISEGAPLISMSWDQARDLIMRRFERSYLTALLQVHRGSVSKAAKAMGVSRQALYKALERTDLNASNFRYHR